jgi:CheY-like chemotaxis protein
VLRNYISNALNFTERGEVRVSAELEDAATITFRVIDTGIGIAVADQARLFHEFGQVQNPLQTKVRGTGLGLSLSKRLGELIGGAVGVTSAPGEGSTFWLRIPIIARGFEEEAVTVARPAAARRESPTVLVVDDEQAARYVLRRWLTAVGCRVIEAAGGHEGLARAAEEQPDVVFLDISMPDMIGTEVLARLKRDPATARIPIVIATSRHVDEAEQQRLKLHAAAVLPKRRFGDATGDAELREALHAAGINL